MEEDDRHTYTRKLDAIISKLEDQRVSQAEMRRDMVNLSQNVSDLKVCFQDHVETIQNKVNKNTLDIVEIKSEKKTALSLIVGVGAFIGSALALFFQFKGLK